MDNLFKSKQINESEIFELFVLVWVFFASLLRFQFQRVFDWCGFGYRESKFLDRQFCKLYPMREKNSPTLNQSVSTKRTKAGQPKATIQYLWLKCSLQSTQLLSFFKTQFRHHSDGWAHLSCCKLPVQSVFLFWSSLLSSLP